MVHMASGRKSLDRSIVCSAVEEFGLLVGLILDELLFDDVQQSLVVLFTVSIALTFSKELAYFSFDEDVQHLVFGRQGSRSTGVLQMLENSPLEQFLESLVDD